MTKCVLGDVAKRIQTGPFGSQLHQSDYSLSGTPVVMPKDLSDGTIVDATIARVGPLHVERLARHKLKEGDLLFSRRGDVGRCALVRKEQEGWLCGTGCLRVELDVEKADYKYLYYFLRRDDVAKWLESHAVGAIMLNINPSIVSQLPVVLPSLDAQRNIAKVLSTIDRKIALNRKRIATLEAMAKEIYDYWFVQFDFPDAHGRPYKSSGGAMVYNPDLKREIPKGWEAKSVNDCGAFFRGVGYSKADERARRANTVLVMRGNNISNGRIVDDSDRVFIDKSLVSAEQLMDRFSVLFAMSSGSKEHVGKAAVYYDYPANAAFGAFCSKYAPLPHYRYMMFCFLASETYRAFVKRICGGTGINNMKPEYFDVPLFAVPHDEALLHKFNDMAEQAYSQIYNFTQEIAKLIGLRDFLLPMLMNGQVNVE